MTFIFNEVSFQQQILIVCFKKTPKIGRSKMNYYENRAFLQIAGINLALFCKMPQGLKHGNDKLKKVANK